MYFTEQVDLLETIQVEICKPGRILEVTCTAPFFSRKLVNHKPHFFISIEYIVNISAISRMLSAPSSPSMSDPTKKSIDRSGHGTAVQPINVMTTPKAMTTYLNWNIFTTYQE